MANFTIAEFMEMLEPLIASPYMGVVVVDRNGFITDMNQTYLKLLETSPEEVMGQYILDVLPSSELADKWQKYRHHASSHRQRRTNHRCHGQKYFFGYVRSAVAH
ncbi:MAG TPA: PAS domain-containing protein [Syntrophomonas sp.]|nr:PAS domain-containing protein [Syntrophomonas sp.]HRW12008.1 PAS domain-containing protein [Syntrophomonas sp.]